MSFRLQPDSLEWAFTHLQKFGDTDVLPVPFEYDAIKSDWKAIRELLEGRDLSQPSPGAQVPFLVPKPEGSFRVITRLDPLDSIVYTAAIYECAPAIEKSRAAREIACAFRIDTAPDGRFFAVEKSWDTWTTRSVELLNENHTTHVVTADISDFYSQISHHRVGNMLENAGIAGGRAQAIEKMLGGWSALQSRGLPVGPHASIILAEGTLNDVDSHLATRGFRHIRYVDDFRIFCGSFGEAVRATHDLCDFLFTAHRLALNPSKTRTYRKPTFLRQVLEKPELIEREKKKEKVQEIMDAWADLGYQLSEAEVDTSDVDIDTLVELFDEAVEGTLKLGLARYALRRAAVLRTNRIQQRVLKKLSRLTPALRDVIHYLEKAKQKKSIKKVAARILEFGLESEYAFLPLAQEWTVNAATGFLSDTLSVENLLQLAKPAKDAIGIRGEALLARARKDLAWVRSHKERWRNSGPWDRRAIIWAGSVLPRDERTAWKRSILTNADPLDRAVAIAALSAA